MNPIAVVAAKRTAVGAFGGSLSTVSAVNLGVTVIQQLLKDTNLPVEQISEVIFGQVLTAGQGQNVARQTSILSGLPYSCPAMTINFVCGSGLKAVALGARSIAVGDSEIVIAGGQESMSQSGHIILGSREGYRMGDAMLIDTLLKDGLIDAFEEYHMGITAENLAKKYKISREEQDIFAAESQRRASKARAEGRFKDEIVPVLVSNRRGKSVEIEVDEFIRDSVTTEALAKLKPIFDKSGTVTAGNSSGINDGAAAVMLMTVDKAKELNLNILGVIKEHAITGIDPKIMGIGPVNATRTCLARAGWSLQDLELIETNEAFAAQVISVNRELDWDTTKMNVNGGAISIGHPIGASGCRILVSLIHEMIRRNAKKGLATLCIGGGQGIALAIER